MRFLAAHRPVAIGLAVGAGALIAALATVLLYPSSNQTLFPNAGPSATSLEGVAPITPSVDANPAGAGRDASVYEHKLLLPLGGSARRSGRLDWTDLSVAEQKALAPLASDWEKLEPNRRRKWLEIADRFPEWTPEEQRRRQERMRELAHLTPEQRRIARDTFAHAQALPPEKRAELFKQYQDLPEERKAQLAAEARSSRSVVASKPLPPRHSPVPSKAQIREGSEQKVPGLPKPAKPVEAAPAAQPSAAVDPGVANAAGPVPGAAPNGAAPNGAASAPSGPSASTVAGPTPPGQPANPAANAAANPAANPTPANPAAAVPAAHTPVVPAPATTAPASPNPAAPS